MVGALRILLAVLLVAALATVAVYVVAFFALTAWTLARGSHPTPLADELDRVLDEILAPPAPPGQSLRHAPAVPARRGRRGARHRARDKENHS